MAGRIALSHSWFSREPYLELGSESLQIWLPSLLRGHGWWAIPLTEVAVIGPVPLPADDIP